MSTILENSFCVSGHPMRILDRGAFLHELQQRIESSCQENTLLGLVLIRIRRCEDVNNVFGYEVGNQLCMNVIGRIAGILRKDDIIRRIGDDTLVLVMPELKNLDHANLAANRILDITEEPFELGSNTITANIAMGISFFPEHAQDAISMFQLATIALLGAIDTHVGFRVSTGAPDTKTASSFIIENDLRHALATDEFILYFQPKIDLNTRLVCGAESLSRWVSASRGFVPPDVFIPVAEQTNLMLPFTLWTLNLAARHFAELKRLHTGFSISVNLSASILHDADVVDLVTRIINIWGIETGKLILEVTESAMMVDPKNSLETLKRFHDIGVGLSIDDFGTGYSSLAYVKKLPVQELKIDKSFVMNMDKDKGDAMIVRTIIDMAHNFGISVTAEGVESQLILEQLADLGCDCIQGFHMAQPMPIKNLHEWMRSSPWGTRLEDRAVIG